MMSREIQKLLDFRLNVLHKKYHLVTKKIKITKQYYGNSLYEQIMKAQTYTSLHSIQHGEED
ncbi:UNVERIFIED_CONTAM: hypothetical protein NCL1_26190 [Trichonephila clavipes]